MGSVGAYIPKTVAALASVRRTSRESRTQFSKLPFEITKRLTGSLLLLASSYLAFAKDFSAQSGISFRFTTQL